MSVARKKKFVIRQTFFDVLHLNHMEPQNSPRENHFNVDWFVSIQRGSDGTSVFLDCPEIIDKDDYYINANVDLKLRKNTGVEEHFYSQDIEFSPDTEYEDVTTIEPTQMQNYLINGKLAVEFYVEILEMTGIKELLVSEKFDESNKEFSDVVLIVEDKKFYVMKQYLAFHSSYFKSLFYGNFDESKQSEVELKDIDPEDFQNYLNLIHAECSVNDRTVDGILKLADFFDSKTAIKRCEKFLLKNSQKTLKEKFEIADKYKQDELMEKCLSKIKTKADMQSLIPEDPEQLSYALWKELLQKAITHWK